MDLKKLVVPVIVGALAIAAAVTMLGSDQQKTLVAHFPRTVSVYEGSEVRVLGVPVGTVNKVVPTGTDVTVSMSYDREVKLPADAKAVIVAPSVVGDRYIQLTPAYSGGEVMADNTELDVAQTSEPLELDDIYASLNELNVALGPDGANKNGALSDLLAVTADNFAGQGAKFHNTIRNVARLSSTLADNKEELFGSAAALQRFMETLAENDQTVRSFNQSLADVSQMLNGERQELVGATRNLGRALTLVETFVEENRDSLGRNIKGLNRVSKVFVKQRAALDEIMHVAPGALNNLALTYNPQAGTLDTRANMGETVHQLESDPAAVLCGFVGQADESGATCDAIEQIFNRPAALSGKRPTVPAREQFDPTLGGLVEVQR
jgi:virulence factor Mce-like protein